MLRNIGRFDESDRKKLNLCFSNPEHLTLLQWDYHVLKIIFINKKIFLQLFFQVLFFIISLMNLKHYQGVVNGLHTTFLSNFQYEITVGDMASVHFYRRVSLTKLYISCLLLPMPFAMPKNQNSIRIFQHLKLVTHYFAMTIQYGRL